MRRHDDPTRLADRANQKIRDGGARPSHAPFRMFDQLIWRQRQASGDLDAIEQASVFVTGDRRQPRHIRQHGSGPLWALAAHQRWCFGHVEALHRGRDRCHRATAFLAIRSLVWMAKGAEPVRGRGWQDGVRVRTRAPRRPPVEPGAPRGRLRRAGTGRAAVTGNARRRAASRVPSRSPPRKGFPRRSHHPPGGNACSRGRASSSCRKSVGRRSPVVWSRAARKRRSVERAGRRSCSTRTMQALAHGFVRSAKASCVRAPLIGSPKRTATPSITSSWPKRRGARRTCSRIRWSPFCGFR